jgi:NADPH:quinone reductase-like Zn-dependent oxidoreductase
MRAVVFDRHGGPEVLQYREVPDPVIGARDVLVRVRACALNHLDVWIRRGIPGVTFSFPHITGADVAGEVAAIGAEVSRCRVGDAVILAPGISCGNCVECLAGRDNLCRGYTVLGYGVNGGCAELIAVPEANVIPKPENLSFPEAAAMALVFLTAWHMLLTRARLAPNDTVLVIAGGSGVGSAAIQIAKMIGARVIATVGSEGKIEKAKSQGADEVILHSAAGFRREVKRLTAGRGVDVVFEHVGTATWDDSVGSLAPGGRLITCGATTGYEAKIDLRFLFTRQLSIMGSYMGPKSELFAVLEMVRRGKLRPVVDSILPLAECAAAETRLERRDIFGKIVLQP